MAILLRLLAVLSAVIFILTVVVILWWFGASGALALLAAGPFGLLAVLGWIGAVVAGPIAAVQLFRLHSNGRVAAVVLFGSVFLYYAAGLAALRTAHLALNAIIALGMVVGGFIVVLMSPSAKRLCADSRRLHDTIDAAF